MIRMTHSPSKHLMDDTELNCYTSTFRKYESSSNEKWTTKRQAFLHSVNCFCYYGFVTGDRQQVKFDLLESRNNQIKTTISECLVPTKLTT